MQFLRPSLQTLTIAVQCAESGIRRGGGRCGDCVCHGAVPAVAILGHAHARELLMQQHCAAGLMTAVSKQGFSPCEMCTMCQRCLCCLTSAATAVGVLGVLGHAHARKLLMQRHCAVGLMTAVSKQGFLPLRDVHDMPAAHMLPDISRKVLFN